MNPFAQMGMQALDKTVSNGIDLAFTPAFQKMQNKQTVFNNNLQMNNNARSSSMMVGAMRAAGLNPALAGGEATFQGGAPSESLPTMSQSMSSAAEKIQAISLDLDLKAKSENNKILAENARKAKYDADLAKINLVREQSYDSELEAIQHNLTELCQFSRPDEVPYNKGTIQARRDMEDLFSSLTDYKVKVDTNKFQEELLRRQKEDPEYIDKIIQKVKDEASIVSSKKDIESIHSERLKKFNPSQVAKKLADGDWTQSDLIQWLLYFVLAGHVEERF